MEYKEYLQQEDYATTTITNYDNAKSRFIEWCESKEYDVETIDYKSCLEYVQHIQQPKKGKVMSKKYTKHHIGALKIFFKYLIEDNRRFTNPMESINIRGVKRTLNHNVLEFEELEDLYYSYQTENINPPSCPSVAMRNKVITGFMVYQGLDATALKSLQYEHINIDKGTIYIPSTRKTNSRTLELKSQQILPLLRYLEKDREVLQEKTENYTQGLFPIKNDRFFITHVLAKELKKFNHKVSNAKQLRASVITYWLKTHNIREVQYMAGHRYISSTERYLQDDLENLSEFIERLHPIC